jgi:hypothetical protein
MLTGTAIADSLIIIERRKENFRVVCYAPPPDFLYQGQIIGKTSEMKCDRHPYEVLNPMMHQRQKLL